MMSQQEIEETFPKTPINDEMTPHTKGNILRAVSLIGAVVAILGVALIFYNSGQYIDIGRFMMVVGSVTLFGAFLYTMFLLLFVASMVNKE